MKKCLLSFCLVLFAMSAWSQTRVITGYVIGSDKDTIPAALISQKGTDNATLSEFDGSYSLTVPEGQSVVLIISVDGYLEKQVTVGATQTRVNINMEKKPDLVVMGYYTEERSNQTTANTSLNTKQVTAVVGGDVGNNIQGKVPGADITTTSGQTGQNANIVIRGNKSISASNSPLILVDNIQYSSLQDVNPNDIQTMEVLKDAAGTAIYGSRGANGVILITTKKGAAGVPKISINSYMGISGVLAYPRAMNGQEFADLKLQSYKTQNPLDATPTYQEALSIVEYNNLVNGVQTDYRKELLHPGVQKDIQFNVSGGNDRISTYFSLDYFNEKGLLKKDELNRYTGRLNLDYKLSKIINVGTQTQVTFYDQSKRVNPLGNAAKINPLNSVPFNPDGTIVPVPDGKATNPLIDEQPNTAQDDLKTTRIFPTIYAIVTPFKGFNARTNLAINWDNRSEGIFNAAQSYTRLNGGFTTAQASHDATQRLQFNWQGILNYQTKLDSMGKHKIHVTALSEVITNKTEQFYVEANGQLIPQQLYYNLGDNSSRVLSSKFTKSALVSFAGRASYNYKGKYMLAATGRTDGASVLAEGHKWDFFPSVSGAWRISEEKFYGSDTSKLRRIVSGVKLRGSWGIAGNSNIDPYSTQSTLTRVPFAFDETGVTSYTYKPQIGNTQTKWEKSATWDFGLDLGFLKDRMTLTFDYYNTQTRDLLLTKKLPLSTGVVQTISNVGKTQNQGIELMVSSVNIASVKKNGEMRKSKFTWSTTLTFMRNREKVLALTDGLTNMQITASDGNTRTVVVGSPVNSFFDYEKIGIWQTDQAVEAGTYSEKPGNIHIKDQNGDGKITTDDRVVVGSTVPTWSGGLNNEFKLYNFDISFFWFARVGSTINYQYAYNATGGENSLSTREYWTPENPSNDLPRPGLPIAPQYLSTLRYTDGSFLKLRSATIGYTFQLKEKKDEEGKVIPKKFGFSRLRLYVSGKNLLVFSKIKDYDPEMAGSLTFPTTRLVVGGLNLDF